MYKIWRVYVSGSVRNITPGFVTQLKGRLIKKIYAYVTIFLDHYSDVTYMLI